jgi:hypothetical protein
MLRKKGFTLSNDFKTRSEIKYMSNEIMTSYRQPQVKAILEGRQTQHRVPLRVQPLTEKSKMWTLAESTDRDEKKYEGHKFWVESNEDMSSHIKGTRSKYFKPKYQPGDIMVVRERARCMGYHGQGMERLFKYEADDSWSKPILLPDRIKPILTGHCVPNGCFKELARIKLLVKRVWYEQIQSISDDDCFAEGIEEIGEEKFHGDIWKMVYKSYDKDIKCCSPQAAYETLWDSIYPGSWERNDWCFCIEFEGI